MGSRFSLLEYVITRLNGMGIRASDAYPGQKFPRVTEPVAAVHIAKVDREEGTVTLEISVICPESFGGAACEVEALRVMSLMREEGMACVQNGCSYDGTARVFIVPIMATYVGVTDHESHSFGIGFQIFVNDNYWQYAVRFADEDVRQHRAEYEIAVPDPTEISLGSQSWEFTVEEKTPLDTFERKAVAGPFEIRIHRSAGTTVYRNCRWISVHREMTQKGIHKIYRGIALEKEEY